MSLTCPVMFPVTAAYTLLNCASPKVPVNTSEVLVAFGIKLKRPVPSSRPKNPVLAALSHHRNSIPLSLPSLALSPLTPTLSTGSSVVVTVDSIVVVAP